MSILHNMEKSRYFVSEFYREYMGNLITRVVSIEFGSRLSEVSMEKRGKSNYETISILIVP